MPEDPLDIDKWFAELDAPATPDTTPIEPESNAEIAFLMDNDTGDTLEAIEENEVGTGQVIEHILPPERDDANLDEAADDELAKALRLVGDLCVKLDKDVRAVGDRVTTTFEEVNSLRLELNTMRMVLQTVSQQVQTLLHLVNDEEPERSPVAPPEGPPARRSRSRKNGPPTPAVEISTEV